jgi:DNA-binding transcriptional ArsR family regulator
MVNQISEEILAQMAARFRILAEASRLGILHCLMDGKEMNVGQVVIATGRNQTNVSKHLKIMAEAAILIRRKEGLQVFYRLENPLWEQVCRLVRSSLPSNNDKTAE